MAQFDHRNLAPTVYATPRHRLPCEVGHAIDAYANGGHTWTSSHRWIAGPTNKRRTDGLHSVRLPRCVNCGKTDEETMSRPKRIRPATPVPDHASDSWLRAAIDSGN
jgi:hypothetical protein